jgi:hypothetical protein
MAPSKTTPPTAPPAIASTFTDVVVGIFVVEVLVVTGPNVDGLCGVVMVGPSVGFVIEMVVVNGFGVPTVAVAVVSCGTEEIRNSLHNGSSYSHVIGYVE